MTRRRLSPRELRAEAARLAREAADDRDATGDPEGAGEFRDLARRLARMRLTR